MRSIIFSAIIFYFCSNAFAGDEVIAFIGEAISATRSEKECEEYALTGHEKDICMDRVFELKYEVKDTLIGKNIGSSIKFIGFFHYWGLPDYTMWKNALVVLQKTKKGYILKGIEWADFVENKWVICKKWSESTDDCIKYIPAIEYLNDI